MGHPYGLRTDDTIVSNVRYNSALSLVIYSTIIWENSLARIEGIM